MSERILAMTTFPIDILGDNPESRVTRRCQIYGWHDEEVFVAVESPFTGLNFHVSVPWPRADAESGWFTNCHHELLTFEHIQSLGAAGTATWGAAPNLAFAWFVSGSTSPTPYTGAEWGAVEPRFFISKRQAVEMARTIQNRTTSGQYFTARKVPKGLTVGKYPTVLCADGKPYVALSMDIARDLLAEMTGKIGVVGLYEKGDPDDRESRITSAQAAGHYPGTMGFAIFTRDEDGDWRASCDSWSLVGGLHSKVTALEVMQLVEAYLLERGYPFQSNSSVYYAHLISS